MWPKGNESWNFFVQMTGAKFAIKCTSSHFHWEVMPQSKIAQTGTLSIECPAVFTH